MICDIETEIRLAMQQEKSINSVLTRAAIASIRADRIKAILSGQEVVHITTISDEDINKWINENIANAGGIG